LTTRDGPGYDRPVSHSRLGRFVLVSSLLLGLAASACKIPTDQDRAKAAEESAKKSLVAIDHAALEQKADADKVKKIQQQLIAVNEYKGDVNGKLDQVTINAYEAFQRSNGLFPDGMLSDKTLKLLEEAAAKPATAPKG
jgi:peptidoglycan hydrolase-like protein with peptidoglycan-binding domain